MLPAKFMCSVLISHGQIAEVMVLLCVHHPTVGEGTVFLSSPSAVFVHSCVRSNRCYHHDIP